MAPPPVALLVTDDAAYAASVAAGLSAHGFSLQTADTAEAARQLVRSGGVAALVVAESLADEDSLQLAAEVRATQPGVLVVLLVPSASTQRDPLAEGVDEVVAADAPPNELGWRVRLRLGELRRNGAARRRERFLRGVVRLADLISPFADVPSLASALTPGLLGLPGVVGVRVLLEAEDIGDEPVVVIEAGRFPADGGGGTVNVALRGVEGSMELTFEPFVAVDDDVREALGAIVGSALSGARQFGALKERQLRLEHGYVDRHRKLSRVSARLERLTESRDSFLALLSHDLRSPLAVVLGQMELLAEGLVPRAQVPKCAATVRRQGERMVQMVEDLLDRYRREDAVRSLPEGGDAVTIVGEMVEAARPLALARQQEITVTAPDVAAIEADAGPIREVLANLLENAVRYSPEGGTIAVTVAVEGARVVIGVQDSGPGFGAAGPGGGSGFSIGLRASTRLAAEAGGTLRTSTSSAGTGGLAVLTLPLAVPQLAASALEVYAGAAAMADPAFGVLSQTWEVHAYEDTVGALERMRRQPPAVVVLDDGVDAQAVAFVRRLKNDLHLAAVPVIAIAGDSAAFYEAGALAVLGRPLAGPLLLAHVRRALRLVGDVKPVGHAPPDVLTGLPTAASLTARLDAELSEARAASRALPVMVVRIEDLKKINRQHGWLVGDQLILWMASRLAERLNPGEVLARVDTDSFALAAPARTFDEVQVLAQECRDTLSRARPRLGVATVDVRVTAQAFDLTTWARGGEG